jgi:hypothetical protein
LNQLFYKSNKCLICLTPIYGIVSKQYFNHFYNKKMKKTILIFAALFTTGILLSQVPGVLPTGNVDGLRPMKPTAVIKPFADIKSIKPGVISSAGSKPTDCDQVLPTAKKFKSLALNTRNGGVWFIGEDDRLYGVGNHYQNCQLATIRGNSKVDNITALDGAVSVRSKDGLGIMFGGNPDPEQVRPFSGDLGWGTFPATATYVYRDVENPNGCAGLNDWNWYLNEKGYIKSANPGTIVSNMPPEKFAKMFTVYNRRFFMIDEAQDLYMWKPGFTAWRKMGDIKATFITTDNGLSTPLWYVGTDNQVYMLTTEEPIPTPMNAKAKSIAVRGSQLHYIGLDGYFYVRLKDKDFRVDM